MPADGPPMAALPNWPLSDQGVAAARRRGPALRPLPRKARPGAGPTPELASDQPGPEPSSAATSVQLAAAASRPPLRAPLLGGFASLDPAATHMVSAPTRTTEGKGQPDASALPRAVSHTEAATGPHQVHKQGHHDQAPGHGSDVLWPAVKRRDEPRQHVSRKDGDQR